MEPREGCYRAAMEAALAAAAAAPAHGDVPVGAVVLDEGGRVVSVAANRREVDGDPSAHAELLAVRAACADRGQWRLPGCTVVVTLEPCVMCAGLLAQAHLATVAFGAYDDRLGAAGSQWDLLRDRRLPHRPEVIGGVMQAACERLLNEFFAERR